MPASAVSEMRQTAYAVRLQGSTVPGEIGLWDRARERHPGVRWWWGLRQIEHHRGAFCYVCDRMVAVWDTRYPVTETARAVIIEHRAEHLPGA